MPLAVGPGKPGLVVLGPKLGASGVLEVKLWYLLGFKTPHNLQDLGMPRPREVRHGQQRGWSCRSALLYLAWAVQGGLKSSAQSIRSRKLAANS